MDQRLVFRKQKKWVQPRKLVTTNTAQPNAVKPIQPQRSIQEWTRSRPAGLVKATLQLSRPSKSTSKTCTSKSPSVHLPATQTQPEKPVRARELIIPETPAWSQNRSVSRSEVRNATLAVPGTPELRATSVPSAMGDLSRRRSETTGDSGSFELQAVSASPLGGARFTLSRKRSRQEQILPSGQQPVDRYCPGPPGRTHPLLSRHQESTRERRESCSSDGEVLSQQNGFLGRKVGNCRSPSIPRQQDEVRPLEHELGIKNSPRSTTLTPTIGSIAQAEHGQAAPLVKEITRLDGGADCKIDDHMPPGANIAQTTHDQPGEDVKRLDVVADCKTDVRIPPGVVSGERSKCRLAPPQPPTSARLRPSTTTSAMTSDLSSRMLPGSTMVFAKTNGATSVSQVPSTIDATVRPTAASAQEGPKPLRTVSHGSESPEDDGYTPPEKRFVREHWRVFQGSEGNKSGATGRGQGRARRGGFAAGRGRRGRGAHKTLVAPNPNPVTGGWRKKQGGQRPRYISLDGHKLTGKDAAEASAEDKATISRNGGKRIVPRTTILRATKGGGQVDSIPGASKEAPSGSERLQLSTYGMPQPLVESYNKRGIRELYQWQQECLCVDDCKPCGGGNLVYSAPTSGGKTLCAEVLIIRSLMEKKGTMALLVVPFIALAIEKRNYLAEVWSPLDLNIQALHGSDGGDSSATEGVHVAVCTIEKANSIVNRFSEEKRSQVLSIVVVDEMHLIGDRNRGYLIEGMLTKLRMVCPTIQLVGLSATLPNACDVAKWLGASLYETEYRPVKLHHRVCCKGKIFGLDTAEGERHGLVKMGGVESIRAKKRHKDPDGVVALIEDAQKKGLSVLVFCPTKKHCRDLAKLLVELLTHYVTDDGSARATVIDKLRETPVGLDPFLADLVKKGVAIHHTGLVTEERTVVEDGFRHGSIRVLVATSTLAAGVNLPAHRVIIRSLRLGKEILDSTRYHQMAGRCGRVGVSRKEESTPSGERVDPGAGESFLIIPPTEDLATAINLITAPLPPLKSALLEATGGGLERALLEAVVSKVVTTRADARRFVSHTLLAAQEEETRVAPAFDAAMDFLLKKSFIVGSGGSAGRGGEESNSVVLSHTQLGKATFFSGLSPSAALDVYRSFDRARRRFVTSTNLHALFLLCPVDVGIELDWAMLWEVFTSWDDDHPAKIVANAVGIEASVLVGATRHRPAYGARMYELRSGPGRHVDLLPYRRFFAALVLQQVVEEVPLQNMASKLGIARGALQSLQKDASMFCGMVVCFARHLQWHELGNVLFSFQDRLGYSAKPELLPLVRLSRDLKPFHARALFEAGYRTPAELAAAEPSRLAKVFLRCSPFRSAGFDESVELYRAQRSKRLADSIHDLAIKELRRQFAALASSAEAKTQSPPTAQQGVRVEDPASNMTISWMILHTEG